MKRMKYLCLFLLGLFFVLEAYSQLSLGVKGGPSIVNIHEIGDHNLQAILGEENSPQIAYHGGLFLSVDMTTKWKGQAEVLYSLKGFMSTPKQANVADARVNLHYLSFPLFGMYQFFDSFEAGLGIEPAFLLNAYSVREDGDRQDISFVYDRTFDFGIGLSFNYHFTPRLSISGRYVQGLTSVLQDLQFTNENGEPLGGQLSVLNQATQLSIMYRLFSNG